MLQCVSRTLLFEPDVYFAECHAATLLPLSGNRFLAACFAGTKEGNPDVGIYLMHGEDGNWSAPRCVAKHERYPCWNPVLFAHDGFIRLHYKMGPSASGWISLYMDSFDEGLTWTSPLPLVIPDCVERGPAKNKPLRLSSGRICAPGSTEDNTRWNCFADLSDDNGQTWHRSAPVPFDHASAGGKGIIQPTLWEDEAGLHMLMRSTEGFIYTADSFDNGESWTAARATALPNNNSGLDLAQLPDKTLALAYNPISGNWASRAKLSVALSFDGGKTFADAFTAQDHENPQAEYSYPAFLCEGSDLYLLYTWKRKSLSLIHLRYQKED